MKKILIIVVFILATSSISFAEDKYVLPETVRRAIVNYLIKQPYEEVATGVEALMTLEKLKPTEEKPPEPKVETPKP